MARHSRLAVLAALAFGLVAGAAAQSGVSGALADVSCLAANENRDAGLAVAQNCGNLASRVTASGTDVSIDCPTACGAAFNSLTTTCKNAITSSDALGGTYRLIFDSCGVSYSGSKGSSGSGNSSTGSPSAPTASGTTANTTIDGSEFTCLASAKNIDAGTRFAQFCAGGALQPKRDSTSDLGFTLTCPANCAAALNDVSQDCINSIASSNNFGGIYSEIFRACKVSVSDSGNSTSTTKAPTKAAATKAPTVAATSVTAAPSAINGDTPTDAPTATTAGTESTTAAPTSGTTTVTATTAPAPAPQAAPRTTGGLATFGVGAMAACALLALLA